MDTVVFIKCSVSKKGDLIASFAIADARWPGEVRSLVLLRCPNYEGIFDEDERGITVSMEGERENQNDVKSHLLTELTIDSSTIHVKTPKRTYSLDVHKTSPNELAQLRDLLTKMNFDGRAKLTGL